MTEFKNPNIGRFILNSDYMKERFIGESYYRMSLAKRDLMYLQDVESTRISSVSKIIDHIS